MKKFILSSGLALLAATANAGVSIDLSVGLLADSNGVVLADGSLIQLIASTGDTVFTAPTAGGSFVGGDDFLLSSFALDSSTSGLAGAFTTKITFDLGVNGLTAGDSLLLRWFPTLTTSSVSAGAGVTYGEFRFDLGQDGGSSWVIPADGQTVAINFLTQNLGGTNADNLGFASSVVIPETSTYAAILGALTLGVVAVRRYRKSAS